MHPVIFTMATSHHWFHVRCQAGDTVQENEAVGGVEWKMVCAGRQTALLLQILPCTKNK